MNGPIAFAPFTTTPPTQAPAPASAHSGVNLAWRRWIVIFFAILGSAALVPPSQAQVTNLYVCPAPPATRLEAASTNVGVVLISAASEIGSLSVDNWLVAVRCKEILNTGTSAKDQGLAIELIQRGQSRDPILVDYDEIAPLVKALDYLTKLDLSVTPLNAFDATYTTKGGLFIAAFGGRRTGMVRYAVRDTRVNTVPIVFTREDMTRLSTLIDQARAKLDSLRG